MKKLHIDIETYSSVDIKTNGAYKYMESEDFEIMLIAYAVDDSEIKIIDLTKGNACAADKLEFTKLFNNKNIKKFAHNAAFERLAFNRIGLRSCVSEWYCTAIKAAYCGWPLGLDAVSKAMDLKDKGKLASGKALIKYFCCPCLPRKSNDFRTRNHSFQDLEKWHEFKQYCIQDVEAEREIEKRLEKYEIPDFERANYLLDQTINDRGILIDLNLAKQATIIDNATAAELSKELVKLTGVENPNSAAQLKKWISLQTGKDTKKLGKAELPILMKENGAGAVSDVLNLRAKISKTSTKKYLSMINCACSDSRARGLLQYYGANRTGRWAGRLIQVQNLPRNYLKDLALARSVVESGDYDLANILFSDLSNVLSQLIRTAFIAKPGKTLGVADFSAIEARIIAWLSREKWRLDVFKTHGKIYEASAAMMFGIPIELVTKESEYRYKGKVAELALGYQGSVGAMKNMGGEAMGLSEQEMKSIVDKWRRANPAIVALWKDTENNVKQAMRTRKKVSCKFNLLHFEYDGTCLTIELPSGRKLYYQEPGLIEGKFGQTIRYKGLDQVTKQWWWVDTYGGKLVENIVQAIARDLLAESMLNLEAEGFEIVMHVHDEVICDIDENRADEELEIMCQIMGTPIDWAEGLPLDADGYHTKFYKKN